MSNYIGQKNTSGRLDFIQSLLSTVEQGNYSPTSTEPLVVQAKKRIAGNLPESTNLDEFIASTRKEMEADTLEFEKLSQALRTHEIEKLTLQKRAEILMEHLEGAPPLHSEFNIHNIALIGANNMDADFWRNNVHHIQSQKLGGRQGKAADELAAVIEQGVQSSKMGSELHDAINTWNKHNRSSNRNWVRDPGSIEVAAKKEFYQTFDSKAFTAAHQVTETGQAGASEPHATETKVTPTEPAASKPLQEAVQAEEAVAKESKGKAKWIIGGIVAATVALGAVMFHSSKKKNHVERENERRQMANGAGQSMV